MGAGIVSQSSVVAQRPQRRMRVQSYSGALRYDWSRGQAHWLLEVTRMKIVVLANKWWECEAMLTAMVNTTRRRIHPPAVAVRRQPI